MRIMESLFAMLIGTFVVDPFKAPAGLKPENFLLRHQLKIALQQCRKTFFENPADAMVICASDAPRRLWLRS
jgi:hypothetical protein